MSQVLTQTISNFFSSLLFRYKTATCAINLAEWMIYHILWGMKNTFCPDWGWQYAFIITRYISFWLEPHRINHLPLSPASNVDAWMWSDLIPPVNFIWRCIRAIKGAANDVFEIRQLSGWKIWPLKVKVTQTTIWVIDFAGSLPHEEFISSWSCLSVPHINTHAGNHEYAYLVHELGCSFFFREWVLSGLDMKKKIMVNFCCFYTSANVWI